MRGFWWRFLAGAMLVLLILPANLGCDDVLYWASDRLDNWSDRLDDWGDDWDDDDDDFGDWLDDVIDDVEDWFD